MTGTDLAIAAPGECGASYSSTTAGALGSIAARAFWGRLPRCGADWESKSAALRREARWAGGLGSGIGGDEWLSENKKAAQSAVRLGGVEQFETVGHAIHYAQFAGPPARIRP
ncbi:MAG: hypothetical protein V4844_08075 [Pseudomonadota bacterium]